MVLIKGYNNTLSQQVHARTSYKPENIVWNARFVPIFSRVKKEKPTLQSINLGITKKFSV
jgi:hypothetical protein